MPNDINIEQLALLLNRLSFRIHLLEVMAVRQSFLMNASVGRFPPAESWRRTAETLEELAQMSEQQIFSAPEYASSSPEQKAMFADEMREIVERLKSMIPKP